MSSISVQRALTVFTLTAFVSLQGVPTASAQVPTAQTTGAPVPPAMQTFGAITGVISNQAKRPVAGATVTATRLDGSGIRATISGSDGIYSFSDVAPGAYAVTSQLDGYSDVVISTVNVTVSHATRIDLAMLAPAGSPIPQTAAPLAITASAAPGPEGNNSLAPRSLRAPDATTGGYATPSTSFWRRWGNGNGGNARSVAGTPRKPNGSAPVASLNTVPASVFDRPLDAAAAPAVVPSVPEALQSPDPAPAVDDFTPFAFADFTWLNGTPRNKDTVLDTKFFTPEIRFDTHFMEDFNQPKDHTIVGATESFRSGEFQLEQVSVGGDFHWQNVRGRILTIAGLFATTTPRNDASAGVGQWDLRNAYRYISEAWGGYHFNVQHGLNVDAGIFMSYIGLFSYYNYDNWTYQPSYVSSNTPWFFNGLRVQYFPTRKLKIEPWLINGWQSYAKFNGHLGLGGQLLWQPNGSIKVVANQYGYGQDNLGLPKTQRIHTDDSIEVKYYDNQKNGNGVSKMAFSLTGDAGAQYGGGLCATCGSSGQKEVFLGWMLYDRTWFHHDLFALTLGGGQMSNPGRYLTLLPPINGADAVTGTPYFTENPGQKAHMYDATVNFQYMPKQYITWWAEAGYRHSDIPYFAGRYGVTPPGGNNGSPQNFTCASGATSGTNDLPTAEAACGGGKSSVWFPDLRHSEMKLSVGVMVKF